MAKKNDIQTISDKLSEIRAPGMAEQLLAMHESGVLYKSDPLSVVSELVDAEILSRKNHTIERYLKAAKLSNKQADLNDIEYLEERKLKPEILSQLKDDEYINKNRNVLILGACGTGKSFIANALASNACKLMHRALYTEMFSIFEDTNLERHVSGDSNETIRKYCRPEVLVIDDFLNRKLTAEECMDLFKIIETRHERKSTIIGTQLEITEWHKHLDNSIIADAIVDRLTANAYKIVIAGPSMRRRKKFNS